jgi:hypothetical protein
MSPMSPEAVEMPLPEKLNGRKGQTSGFHWGYMNWGKYLANIGANIWLYDIFIGENIWISWYQCLPTSTKIE